MKVIYRVLTVVTVVIGLWIQLYPFITSQPVNLQWLAVYFSGLIIGGGVAGYFLFKGWLE